MILIIFLMMLPPLIAFGLFEVGLSPAQVMILFLVLALIPYCYMICKVIFDSRGDEDESNE